MDYKRVLAVLLGAGIVLVWLGGSVLTGAGDGLRIDWSVIASGGGRSASSGYQVQGSIGQSAPAPPTAAGGDYRVEGGYWVLREPTARPTTPAPEKWHLYLPIVRR